MVERDIIRHYSATTNQGYPGGEADRTNEHFFNSKGGDGTIDLLPAHAAKDTRVWISMTPKKPVAGLSIEGAATAIKANLSRMIKINSGGQQLGERVFGRPRPIVIEATYPKLLDLVLRLKNNPDITFPSHIMVSSLSLKREENEGRRHRRIAHETGSFKHPGRRYLQ